MREAQEARVGADKSKKEAELSLRQAKNERERAEQAREEQRKANIEKNKATEQVRTIKQDVESSKSTYKSLFIGQALFTLALAYFVAYGKRGVLSELGLWFPSRWQNLKAFVSWNAMRYMAAIQQIQGNWDIGNWAYLIVSVIALLIFGIFLFIANVLIVKIAEFVSDIRFMADDITFKDIISGDIALISLYIVLFFSDPIKKVFPFNILSIWLIMSCIGIAVWYINDIKEFISRKSW